MLYEQKTGSNHALQIRGVCDFNSVIISLAVGFNKDYSTASQIIGYFS